MSHPPQRHRRSATQPKPQRVKNRARVPLAPLMPTVLALAGSAGIAPPAAAVELQARVSAVRAALAEAGGVGDVAETSGAGPAAGWPAAWLMAQASNWTNWPKWSKWSNWANK